MDGMQELHEPAVSRFEGTGPGGGWDIKGMAHSLSEMNGLIALLLSRIDELERKLEDLALIAPGRSTAYLPRNRRT
jgi:hypothetical protein